MGYWRYIKPEEVDGYVRRGYRVERTRRGGWKVWIPDRNIGVRQEDYTIGGDYFLNVAYDKLREYVSREGIDEKVYEFLNTFSEWAINKSQYADPLELAGVLSKFENGLIRLFGGELSYEYGIKPLKIGINKCNFVLYIHDNEIEKKVKGMMEDIEKGKFEELYGDGVDLALGDIFGEFGHEFHCVGGKEVLCSISQRPEVYKSF